MDMAFPILAIMLLAVSSAQSSNLTGQNATSPFNLTTPYPISATGQQCVAYNGYIYCIGGYTDHGYVNFSYYSTVNSSGIGRWMNTTPFPVNVTNPACVSSNGYIYCIGFSNTNITESYYARINGSGIGQWALTSGIPKPLSGETCTSVNSTIYCIGGLNPTLKQEIRSTSSVYYAALDKFGIGPWNTTAGYPYIITGESCPSSGSTIYCIGGLFSYSIVNKSFYAGASSSGISRWTGSTPYPISVNNALCSIYNGYVFCISGSSSESPSVNFTYYAPISSTGMLQWTAGKPFPTNQTLSSCPAYDGYVYCIGPGSTSYTNATYFAFLPALTANYTSPSTTVTTSIRLTTIPSQINQTTVQGQTTTISSDQSSAGGGSLIVQLVIVAAIIIAIYAWIRIRGRSATNEKQ